jgi:hypothetical protein
MKTFNSFLIIVETDYQKKFAFFVPNKFEYATNLKSTSTQLAFYWINDDQLVTCINKGLT